MSASVRTISGNIGRTRGPSIDCVMWDGPNTTGVSDYSPGGARAQQLPINPSAVQRFSVVGYSAQMRLSVLLSLPSPAGGNYARFGDLWAGLYVGAPLPVSNSQSAATDPAQGGPVFPTDLSTFSEFWNGDSDPIRVLGPNRAETEASIIARNVMLPVPVTVNPGTQLGFGAVLTPSLMSQWVSLILHSVSYTVLYTVETML